MNAALRPTGRRRPLVAALATAIAVIAAGLSAHLAHAAPAEPVVPTDIAVPAGNKLFLVGHAVGVQIHTCVPIASGYRWNFVAPRANLYGDNGQLLTTHSGGPTWTATDGSTAVGSVVGRATVDPTAIQWLKLAVSTAAGPDGDRLEGTTYIQRIATTGGLAPPAAACNEGTVGTTEEVPYTADYYFWKASTG
jgi:hypothetical protein